LEKLLDKIEPDKLREWLLPPMLHPLMDFDSEGNPKHPALRTSSAPANPDDAPAANPGEKSKGRKKKRGASSAVSEPDPPATSSAASSAPGNSDDAPAANPGKKSKTRKKERTKSAWVELAKGKGFGFVLRFVYDVSLQSSLNSVKKKKKNSPTTRYSDPYHIQANMEKHVQALLPGPQVDTSFAPICTSTLAHIWTAFVKSLPQNDLPRVVALIQRLQSNAAWMKHLQDDNKFHWLRRSAKEPNSQLEESFPDPIVEPVAVPPIDSSVLDHVGDPASPPRGWPFDDVVEPASLMDLLTFDHVGDPASPPRGWPFDDVVEPASLMDTSVLDHVGDPASPPRGCQWPLDPCPNDPVLPSGDSTWPFRSIPDPGLPPATTVAPSEIEPGFATGVTATLSLNPQDWSKHGDPLWRMLFPGVYDVVEKRKLLFKYAPFEIEFVFCIINSYTHSISDFFPTVADGFWFRTVGRLGSRASTR
jgi:hypothetical protein